MRIDLTEEGMEDIINSYFELLEDIEYELNYMNDKLEVLCEYARNKHFVRTCDEMLRTFDQKSRQKAKVALGEWIKGKKNFKSIAEAMFLGEAAEECAAELDNAIHKVFEEFWNKRNVKEIRVDTAETCLQKEYIDEVQDIFRSGLDSTKNVIRRHIMLWSENYNEGNEAYLSLLVPAEAVFKPIIEEIRVLCEGAYKLERI